MKAMFRVNYECDLAYCTSEMKRQAMSLCLTPVRPLTSSHCLVWLGAEETLLGLPMLLARILHLERGRGTILGIVV